MLLPAAVPTVDAPTAPAASADQDTTQARGTILLVEDEDGVRTVVRRALERQGYDVREASSGAEAMRLAESIASTGTAVDVVPRGDQYLIRLRAGGDAELELWAAHRHAKPLADVLQRPLRFEVSGRQKRRSHADQSHHASRVSGKAVRRGGHRRVRKNDPARTAGEMA